MTGITFDPLETGFNADSRSFESLKKAFPIGPEQTGNAVYSVVMPRLIKNARQVGPITWYATQAHINDLSHRIAPPIREQSYRVEYDGVLDLCYHYCADICVLPTRQVGVSDKPENCRSKVESLERPYLTNGRYRELGSPD